MLKQIPAHKVLFLDIETVPMVQNWSDLTPEFQDLWLRKVERQLTESDTAEDFYQQRVGILSEFGKIICISCGIIVKDKLRLTSFYGHDEKIVLEGFIEMLQSKYFSAGVILCAHNGKEFDFPYMARKMLINGL